MDIHERTEEKRRKNYMLRRSITDYGMGIVFLGFAIFLIFAEKLGFQVAIDNLLRYIFIGLLFLYGSFRIYRGYAKAYFRDED